MGPGPALKEAATLCPPRRHLRQPKVLRGGAEALTSVLCVSAKSSGGQDTVLSQQGQQEFGARSTGHCDPGRAPGAFDSGEQVRQNCLCFLVKWKQGHCPPYAMSARGK